ncbi:MAG: hypothetical protein QG611_621, partial [Bacteroidota bacterium]|nr:hypothetical protein [Bacteroidota bacterium]
LKGVKDVPVTAPEDHTGKQKHKNTRITYSKIMPDSFTFFLQQPLIIKE